MAVPYTFSTATGSLPLSQLDSNFSTAITIGNTAVVLGDTISTINNLTLANVAITSVSTAFPNGYLANSNVIVGTTTLTLGSTVTSINGLSLSNVTISSGNVTISNVTTTNVTATTANVTTANVGTLVVIGDATVGGNTAVTGNISAAKGTFTSANVTGTANVQVIAVTQNATVAGNVTVTGNVSAANGTFTSANISGTSNISTLVVTGTSTLVGVATLTANPVLSAGTANGVTYLNGSKSLTSGTGLVFDGTNLGIGVTPSATWGSDKAIQIGTSSNTSFLSSGDTSGAMNLGKNAYSVGSSPKYVGNGYATNYYQSAGTHVWQTAASNAGGAGAALTWSSNMTLDASGNLGVGTTTPATWGTAANPTITLKGTNGSYTGRSGAFVLLGQNGFLTGALAADDGTSALQFYAYNGTAGGTERMRIDSSGNVGIGTSSPGTYGALTVRNSGNPTIYVGSSTAVSSGAVQADGAGASSYPSLHLAQDQVNIWSMQLRADTNLHLFRQSGTGSIIVDAGNLQVLTGAVMPYAPAPAAISAAATLTNANIQGQIISATGTTYTITMPLGTTMETLATWATTNIAYDFFVINTASGIITMAVNTGVTSLGALTVAIGASAHFRIRRTAANTFVLYRLV